MTNSIDAEIDPVALLYYLWMLSAHAHWHSRRSTRKNWGPIFDHRSAGVVIGYSDKSTRLQTAGPSLTISERPLCSQRPARSSSPPQATSTCSAMSRSSFAPCDTALLSKDAIPMIEIFWILSYHPTHTLTTPSFMLMPSWKTNGIRRSDQ